MKAWLARIGESGSGGAPYCLWLFLAAFIFFHTLEKRAHWQLRAALCALAFALAGWLFPSTRWSDSVLLVGLWYTAAWLLISLQCYAICRISPEEAFFCGINAVLAEHIGSCVLIILTVRFSQGNIAGMNSYSLLAYVIVYIVIYLTVGRILIRGQEHLKVNRLSVAITTVTGLTVTIWLSMLLKSNIDPDMVFELADPHAIALLETGQLYAIFFCVSMLVLQCVQQRELITSEKLAAIHELWTVRQKQYEMSRETIDMINRKCHDMKHQVAALMAEGQSSGDRQRYSEEIERLIEIYDLRVNTENEALNTILMEKGLYCNMQGIRWNCAVDGTSLGFIDRMDLYVLLGNALDNAVEAVQHVTDSAKRIIQLQICRRDSFVLIRLENSFEGPLQWEDHLPLTTKSDKASHGIGLRSIRSIALKYGGDACASTEDQAFILSILIPIPQGNNTNAKETKA